MLTNPPGDPKRKWECVIHEGPAAKARLNELDLEEEWLATAATAAAIARASATKLDPIGADGQLAYFACVRTLSQQILFDHNDADKWERVDPYNIPRVVNKETALAIAVSGANARVGLRGPEPCSKNDKGFRFKEIVAANVRRLTLFEDPRFMPVPDLDEQQTYVLLYYSDIIGTVRAELSLPTAVDDDGYLAEWRERIFVEIPNPGAPVRRIADDDGENEFPVVVTRRH
jgi:hypothetical protein